MSAMSEPVDQPSALPHADVYTDGGCDPNPGPGGWAAIIRLGELEWTLNGSDPDTTNNRMELQAAAASLALLEGLLGRCQVELYTDSQYLRRGITEWVAGWAARGWRIKDGTPVKNEELWRLLDRLTRAHEINWHWLPGHTGHPFNERADRLSTEARRAMVEARRGGEAPQPGADDRPAVEICVKSSCQGSTGRCGWGAVLRMDERTSTLQGSAEESTANAMLIRGATEALRALKKPCRVALYSDADYLVKGASLWVKGWQARGWRTKEGKPVANRAEWEALLEAARSHQVTWLLPEDEALPPDLEQAGKLAAEAAGGEGTDASESANAG